MLPEVFVSFLHRTLHPQRANFFPQTNLKILLILVTKMVKAPCIRIQSRPYESALSHPNTFFNSAFLASILISDPGFFFKRLHFMKIGWM